ncbi:MAG: transposase [Flavobacteriaceae bacterium]|nr:transposase [Flavobacteriaceae bacterium]
MKKHSYHSKKINKINWNTVKETLSGEEIALAIDLAKQRQYAMLFNEDASLSVLFHWQHPEETPMMLKTLKSLGCPVVVILESTSTYGDALRYQFRKLGFTIHQASAKRVHDAREVYDGVPSLHDAKAATIIARFYRDGLTKPWQELSVNERTLGALRREYEIHQSQYQRNKNRLEAYLSRHWPEVLYLLDLDSVTLEQLLINYGSAKEIAANAEKAAREMKCTSKGKLSQDKINKIIESAVNTLGVPCIEGERIFLHVLAKEMKHSRLHGHCAKKALEAEVDSDEELFELGCLIGKVTTAVLLSYHLDPRKFNCAHSHQKAMGLNLKEKSSGRYVGQLKLTKRGNSKVRQYLYYAALRLLQRDAIVRQWYLRKVDPKAKNKTVIAVMRKLSKALWHVARVKKYDASLLFSVTQKAG